MQFLKRWVKPLTQLPRKALCPEVRILLKQPKVIVPRNGSDLHYIQTLLKETAYLMEVFMLSYSIKD